MLDALGNEIIMGATYMTKIGGTQEKNTSLVTGVAIKEFEGHNGTKITLQLTRVEGLAFGMTSSIEKVTEKRLGSFYSRHLFPIQSKV